MLPVFCTTSPRASTKEPEPTAEVNSAEKETVTGWDGHDPFEDHAGPFFFRKHEDGSVTCAFEAKPHHCNGGGFLHGGMLMTFADYSLFAIGSDVVRLRRF